MNIVYFANGHRGTACLSALIGTEYQPVAVVLHGEAEAVSGTNPTAALARKAGVPVLFPKKVNAPEFVQVIRQFAPDLMVLGGYAKILGNSLLAVPPLGTINLHGGKLPEYRGGSPINWQIINGDPEGGCCVLYVDEGVDTGGIIFQERYHIGPDMTSGEAMEVTLRIFPRLLINALDAITSGTVRATPQSLLEGTHYCKRYPLDGRINWESMTALQVHNLARGLNGPALPGAFTFLDSTRIVVWKTELMDYKVKGVPGRVALRMDGGMAVIACDQAVLVKEIKLDDNPEPVASGHFFRINGATLR